MQAMMGCGEPFIHFDVSEPDFENAAAVLHRLGGIGAVVHDDLGASGWRLP